MSHVPSLVGRWSGSEHGRKVYGRPSHVACTRPSELERLPVPPFWNLACCFLSFLHSKLPNRPTGAVVAFACINIRGQTGVLVLPRVDLLEYVSGDLVSTRTRHGPLSLLHVLKSTEYFFHSLGVLVSIRKNLDPRGPVTWDLISFHG